MGISTTAKYPVKGVRNAASIIEALKKLGGGGISEIADETDLPRSSVHSYVNTLRESGLVVKEDQTYYLGVRFLDFGISACQRHDLYSNAKEQVDELAEETGELANAMIEEQGLGMYTHRATGREAVSVDATVGDRVTLHNTALGKAILAHKPRDEVEEILDAHGMERTTDHTITDEDSLFEQFEEIRDDGVAFDRQERLPGLRCVATPILNQADEPVGAISVSGPTSRLNGDRFNEEIPKLLLDAKNIIELNISYSD